MALTGRPGRPALGPPAGLVPKLRALGARLGDGGERGSAARWRWIPLRCSPSGRRSPDCAAGARRAAAARSRSAPLPRRLVRAVTRTTRGRRPRAGLARALGRPRGPVGRHRARRSSTRAGDAAPRAGSSPRSARRPAAVGEWRSARGYRSSTLERAADPLDRPRGRAGRGAGVAVGGAAVRLPARGGRGRRGQGGVDRPARRRSQRPTGLLRPPQRRQAQRRPRPDDGARGGRAPSAGRDRRRGDRGVATTRPRAARDRRRPPSSPATARAPGCRSPATVGRVPHGSGSRSATTPPSPEDSSRGTAMVRCSAPMPSPTPRPGWWPRWPSSRPWRPAATI